MREGEGKRKREGEGRGEGGTWCPYMTCFLHDAPGYG